MTDSYHASRTELGLGTVLESRFVGQEYKYQWDIVSSALDEGPLILKSLLLADLFVGRGKKSVLPFVLKEMVLERIRASEFGDRPSRINSIFLCPTKADIVRFRAEVKHNDDRPYLYLCTVEDAAPFQADMSFVRSANLLAPIEKQLNHLNDGARRYWQGDKSDNPTMEIIARPGTVKITAQAEW